jgi:glucose-1-phosphate thymidylyltransferase
VEFAKNHGVWNPETNEIIEKPIRDIGRRAVIGVYVYDQRVYDVIRQLKPSARGELEITDINNWYLKTAARCYTTPASSAIWVRLMDCCE